MSEIEMLLLQNRILKTALKKIAKWYGEFPKTKKKYMNGTEVSYGGEYGSNGERDYMRGIAQKAIDTANDI